ncbi:class I SAM-dependent methyltransferase [Actinophytocola sp.]|uniref:class I SAM-dependent methyltransferase n=1 Tax=Actinophytocola sp. TaxID=1872138 RepID=UPI002ED1CE75
MITPTIDRCPLPDRGQDWPPLPEQEHKPLHGAVLTALGPLAGKRLLDVGCGVGLFLRAAEQRGALVAGTDAAVERLEIARWALPEADLRVAGAGEALPFDNGTFDVVTARGPAVLTELVRVVRPGGSVVVGNWARPPGCWAEQFAGHLRRLAARPIAGTEERLDGALRAAGLAVWGAGDVQCTATYPTVGAAWTAMLSSEDVLRTIRLAGEAPVRAAFAEAVAGKVTADGTVRLPKTFRYVVASTMWTSPLTG